MNAFTRALHWGQGRQKGAGRCASCVAGTAKGALAPGFSQFKKQESWAKEKKLLKSGEKPGSWQSQTAVETEAETSFSWESIH